MLRVRMPLFTSAQEARAVRPELQPYATAEIAVHKEHGTIKIVLEGVIIGTSAKELRAFLKDVASFRATVWKIELANLRVISAKGLRILVNFSRLLQSRGAGLKIENLHNNIYTTLQELNLLQEFEWPD